MSNPDEVDTNINNYSRSELLKNCRTKSRCII